MTYLNIFYEYELRAAEGKNVAFLRTRTISGMPKQYMTELVIKEFVNCFIRRYHKSIYDELYITISDEETRGNRKSLSMSNKISRAHTSVIKLLHTNIW